MKRTFRRRYAPCPTCRRPTNQVQHFTADKRPAWECLGCLQEVGQRGKVPSLATKVAKLTNELSRVQAALYKVTEEIAEAERELDARRLRDAPPSTDSPAYGIGRLMADAT